MIEKKSDEQPYPEATEGRKYGWVSLTEDGVGTV
jgi:hypothetical protein